jgi:hypothetical protein
MISEKGWTMKLVDMIMETVECDRPVSVRGITTCGSIPHGRPVDEDHVLALVSLDDAALATMAGGQGLGGYAGSDFYGGPNGFGGWGTVATPEGVMVWHAVSGPSGFNIWLGQGYTSLA